MHPATRDKIRKDACVVGSSDTRHSTRHHNSVNDVRRYRRCEFEVRAPEDPGAMTEIVERLPSSRRS